MKRVLIITYYWPPSGGGGVQRWVKFAKYLQEFNIEPIVLTVDPKLASYAIIDESMISELPNDIKVFTTKSREPFNIYKKFTAKKEIPFGGFANEERPGITQKISRFIRGNFFIPDARIGWNKFAYRKAIELIEKFDIETVITSSPPHSTQLIGLKLKRDKSINWIADLRDPWTDIYYYNRMYHSPIAKKLDLKKEFDVLNNADKVIVVSQSIKSLFASKITPSQKDKISVISNGYDSDDFKSNNYNINDRFTITYTGTLADNYNIDGFLKALISVVNKFGESKIKIQFVGRVTSKYQDIINKSILKQICSFEGHVAHKASISHLKNANALFLAIPYEPQNEGILTGKLFEYLAARKPIVGVGPVDGDAAVIINECEAGKMFNYSDVQEISNYIIELYNRWTESPKLSLESEVYTNYSRVNLTKKLVTLIQ
ncbi:MAG: glycosyltransferase family 4 protein [Bacteroidota bacterium]